MSSEKVSPRFRFAFIIGAAILFISCGGSTVATQPPPITNPPGADATELFFATSFGGGIVGMSASSGHLVASASSSIHLPLEIRNVSADPNGAFLVVTTPATPSVQAQIVNIQPGGALIVGPTIPLPGNAEGSASLNGRIAIPDSDHNQLNLYEISGGNVTLKSSTATDPEPRVIAFDGSGKHIYVANRAGRSVSVFSVSSTSELHLQQTASLVTQFGDFPGSPTQLRLNPAGTKLAVVALDGQVFVWNISPTDGTLSTPIKKELTLYTNFQDLAFDPSGQMLYALDTENNLIYGYSLSDYMLTPLIGSPYKPNRQATGITMNAKGDRLYAVELFTQVETFTRNSTNGQLTSNEILWITLSFTPGQIIRVPMH